MSRKDATLHDVARVVGVSTRTVSRVVRGETGFSAATEQRVRDAIDELGYRPNLLARGLISGRTNTIGLVGGDLTDPFFPELADGVQRAAHDVGLTTFFAGTITTERQGQVLDSLMSHGVDGVILFPTFDSEPQIHEFANNGLSLVIVDAPVAGHNIASVLSDIEAGATLAVTHLQDRGRSRIAFIGNGAPSLKRRETGYRNALDSGAAPIVALAEPTAAGGMEATRWVLDNHPEIDAIFAYNDLMALGAARVLAEAGRRVPGDVALVGFDNIAVSEYVAPALTTIQLDRERLGRTAVATMVELLDGDGDSSPPLILPVELIVRESS